MANMDASATYQSMLAAQRTHGGNDQVEVLDHILAQFWQSANSSATVSSTTVATAITNAKTSIKARKRNY